jgi:hypothetical protein
MIAKEIEIVFVPCSKRVRETKHHILFQTTQHDEQTMDTYALLSCCGCENISLGHRRLWLNGGSVQNCFYPSPVSRKEPDWVFWLRFGNTENLAELLNEIYKAVDGGQHRLAAMGIRALLEQVMIMKVGDLATFDQKLDAFQEKGFISFLQRDAMRATLHVGDAAMHRAFKPTEADLKVALDIVEGVLAPIVGHKDAAEKLTDRVPPRAPKPPK